MGFSGSETVALLANPGGSTLSGTLTATATGGVASFSGLNLNNPGSGYTLTVTSAGLTSATSGSFSVVANAPSLSDPGFELPALATGAYQYNPNGSPWTFSGDAGVANNNSAFTTGNPSAPQGNQVAFLQITGSASQSVTFAGGTYSISFDAAQRAIGPSNQTFEVLIDSTIVGTFTPSGTSYSLYTTPTFSVTAGAHTVKFLGLDPKGGDNTALVDAVTVQANPQNQPSDPGFELPAVAAGAYQYDPTGSPWTFSGYAGVAGNGSAFTTGNPNAPQGSQVAFIQNYGFGESIGHDGRRHLFDFVRCGSACHRLLEPDDRSTGRQRGDCDDHAHQ